MDLLELMKLDIWCYFKENNMIQFTIGLDILLVQKVVLLISKTISAYDSLPLEKTLRQFGIKIK